MGQFFGYLCPSIQKNQESRTDIKHEKEKLQMMEKKLFIKNFRLKEEVKTLFYVKYISLMEARDGRKYINIILSDSTGDLEARIWSNADEHAQNISTGNFIQANGKLNLFQGRKQFIIQEAVKVGAQ